MPPKMIKITASIPEEAHDALQKLADAQGLPVEFFVRDAIRRYFEDRYDYRIALERMSTRSGPLIPFEDINRELGIDDDED